MTIILVPMFAFILTEIGTSIVSICLNKPLSEIFPCNCFCILQNMAKSFRRHANKFNRCACRARTSKRSVLHARLLAEQGRHFATFRKNASLCAADCHDTRT